MPPHPPQEYEGPQTVSPENFDQTVVMVDRCFRPNEGSMGTQYPLLFRRDALEQLRMFTAAGQPASFVGTIISDLAVFGCSLRVACIGSVCTAPEHRGHGLASRLVLDSADRAAAQGAAVMLISGGRGMYLRLGAARGGRWRRYELAADQLPRGGEEITIEAVSGATIDQALRLYETEPVRFRRSRDEFATQLACEWTLDRPGHGYLVRRSSRLLGFVATHDASSKEARILGISELAGSREAIFAALPKIVEAAKAEAVHIDAYEWDMALADLCARAGAKVEVIPHRGTIKLLDPQRLWDDFTPLLIERTDAETISKISLHPEADDLTIHTLTFRMDGQDLILRGPENLTATLFGAPDVAPLADASGPLGETLRRALPLPLPLYGMNYV